ncbi:MAG: ATP-binding cassette domain-containing protein [Candidatus Azobacteroides sp.]|nr:ATP-binding cassette domain-containing protein [Candidatus Azobacteroides sp.]
MSKAIEVAGLKKSFHNRKGKRMTVEAVRGVSLSVESGEIFGFLGPNGAGKTTTLRMLTTLLPIDEGKAVVAGFDLKKQQKEVRRSIGYVGQSGGADLAATGMENLILAGRLYGMGRKEAQKRADELAELLDIRELLPRLTKTYSGGQKRRLEVALGMVQTPKVLFLDEPTTGLDPQNRANLWEQIRRLRNAGTTIFLTTHYLDEADMLADRLAIMDYGLIVAQGTPNELKQQISNDVIRIKLKTEQLTDGDAIKKLLKSEPYIHEIRMEGDSIHLYVDDSAKAGPHVFALLERGNMEIDTISFSRPSLDDVFLKQTGRLLRDTGKGGVA